MWVLVWKRLRLGLVPGEAVPLAAGDTEVEGPKFRKP